MIIVLGVLLIVVGLIIVWFHISYSPIKKKFIKDINRLIAENYVLTNGEVFTEEDFSHLPVAIQKYIKSCGYIGTKKMSYLKIDYRDINFMQGENGPALSIDYTQYNFVNKPCRMAFIDSSIYGIPFQGYDFYQDGKGGMKGVIAKAITLFNQTGKDMDKACLATFLSESLFIPSILLENYVIFEEINDFEVKATITYEGITASGIFTFNKQYEMISFTTKDRAVTNADGTMEYVPWSALCSEYKVGENGIKLPMKLQAVWNYPDRDFIYFYGVISEALYGFK